MKNFFGIYISTDLAEPVALRNAFDNGRVAVCVVGGLALVANQHLVRVSLLSTNCAADVLGRLVPVDTLVQVNDVQVHR